MTYKHKFMITEGLMIFAFAYTAKGYHSAAVFTAVCAVLYAYAAADRPIRINEAGVLIFAGLAEAMLIRGSGLMKVLPSLPAVSFCTLAASVLMVLEKWRKLHHSIRLTVLAYALFILIALMIPSPIYGTAGTVMILSLLYLPWISVYSICRLQNVLHMFRISGLKGEMHVR